MYTLLWPVSIASVKIFSLAMASSYHAIFSGLVSFFPFAGDANEQSSDARITTLSYFSTS